jgi:hypothetical protein
MSSNQRPTSAELVCLYCGAPELHRGPFAPEWTKLREFAPNFVAHLVQEGWIEPIHPGGHAVGDATRMAQRVGDANLARTLCGHRYERVYFERLRDLEERLGERPQTSGPEVRRELFALVIESSRYRREDGTAWAPSRKVVAEAIYELALLRKRLPTLAEISTSDSDSLIHSSGILCMQPDPWLLVRSLVQLLRAAPVPTLTLTLRYWRDTYISEWPLPSEPTQEDRELAHDREIERERELKRELEWIETGNVDAHELYVAKPPLPSGGWSRIPAELAYSLHDVVVDAERDDPALRQFRTKFSRYLLDRLKPHGPSYEENPVWRVGCLRAVDALQINPENTGHRTVYAVAEKDPHESVRAAATTVYPRIRRSGALHTSVRRVVLNAIWELFRAHMLALGAAIDEPGAEQTKREMIRRTTRWSKEGSHPKT